MNKLWGFSNNQTSVEQQGLVNFIITKIKTAIYPPRMSFMNDNLCIRRHDRYYPNLLETLQLQPRNFQHRKGCNCNVMFLSMCESQAKPAWRSLKKGHVHVIRLSTNNGLFSLHVYGDSLSKYKDTVWGLRWVNTVKGEVFGFAFWPCTQLPLMKRWDVEQTNVISSRYHDIIYL